MIASAPSPVKMLADVPENKKAEIVGGALVTISPTGFLPHYAASEIFASLREYGRRTRSGYAIADNAGFIVDLPNRQSFSPNAAFYTHQPSGMRFLRGAPMFAVEVRSENDYGETAEELMAVKRAEYFSAGTLVIWDVDLLSQDVVRVYRTNSAYQPDIFRRGEVANAEPAVPGWTIAVDDLFPYSVQQG